MINLWYEFEYVQIRQIIFDVQGKREYNASQNQTGQCDERFYFKSANQINEKWCDEKELSISREIPWSQVALKNQLFVVD